MKEKINFTSISQNIEHPKHPLSKTTDTANRRTISADSATNLFSFFKHKAYAIVSILLLAFILPNTATAHRGAKGEVDTCRISVGKEVIHFSAYTPSLTGGKSFCHIIPEIGITDIVIDYEGKKLRNTTVEFEITKEPEGSRVYYNKPEKFKKGTVDAKVDFTQYGAGDYLLHVTVVNAGETIDSHLPFSVGVEAAESIIPNKILIPFIIIVIIFAVMFGMSRSKKNQPPSEGKSEA